MQINIMTRKYTTLNKEYSIQASTSLMCDVTVCVCVPLISSKLRSFVHFCLLLGLFYLSTLDILARCQIEVVVRLKYVTVGLQLREQCTHVEWINDHFRELKTVLKLLKCVFDVKLSNHCCY